MSMMDAKNDVQQAPSISLASPKDYFELLKPRVMQLVVFTAFVGIVLAPQGGLHPFLAAVSLLSLIHI